jgi:hypothetical protein
MLVNIQGNSCFVSNFCVVSCDWPHLGKGIYDP